MSPRRRPVGRRGTPATPATSPKGARARASSPKRQPLDPRIISALRRQLDALEASARGSSGGTRRRGASGGGDVAALRALLSRALGEDIGPTGPGTEPDPGDAAWDEDAWDEEAWDDESWDDDEPDPATGEEGPPGEDWDPDWDGRRWYPPSKPIRVEGGLVARTRRGAIGETWWSRRFLAAMEAVMVGGRLTRGRSYARKGQVIDLEVGPGLIEAHVQGSRKTPYRVRLAMAAVEPADWDRIVAALASESGYAARLLAGELPHEVEDVFAREGASLFPGPGARLASGCTCPDWANPCKHVAAVCYLVAEAFDRDPFLVLQWRGRGRDAVLGQLRALRREASVTPDESPAGTARDTSAPEAELPPLAACVLGFWKAGPELADVRIRPVRSALPDAVLRNVPRGLLEVRGRDASELLGPAYAAMTEAAARRALGIAARTRPTS